MIGVTGDVHADLTRFKHKNLKKLRKNDFLIICGDFGFLWDGSKKEQRILKQIGKLRYNVLFVDGCHENYDLLNKYEETDWNGGRVRVISGRLMQLERGYVYKIGDQKIFAFGGGQSDDLDIRRAADTWWKEEIPTVEEIDRAVKSLEASGNIVDYIITHEPPASLKDFLQIDMEQKSEMSTYFDNLRLNCKFKRWFFGKCHINKAIPPQYQAIFDTVIILN